MANSGANGDRGLLGEPPSGVRVTVLAGPRGPTLRHRIAAGHPDLRARTITAVVAVVVAIAIAASAATTFMGVGGRIGRDEPRSRLRPAGVVRVVAASIAAYPIGCLSVAIALHDPRFTRASFDRTLPCVRRRMRPAHGIDRG